MLRNSHLEIRGLAISSSSYLDEIHLFRKGRARDHEYGDDSNPNFNNITSHVPNDDDHYIHDVNELDCDLIWSKFIFKEKMKFSQEVLGNQTVTPIMPNKTFMCIELNN